MFNNGYNGGYQNGNQNQVSVNTTLYTLYSDYSALKISAWNDQLSLRFNPRIPNTDGFTNRRYDYQNTKITAIHLDAIEALKKAIDKKIVPVVEELENGVTPASEVSVAIKLTGKNGTNVLSVEIRKDEDSDNYGVFLVFYGSVSETLQASDAMTATYKFGTHSMVLNYNPLDGSVAGDMMVESEFRLFYHILEKALDVEPFGYHGQKYSNAIRQQMQVNGFQQNNMNGNGNLPFNNVSSNTTGYTAQTTSVDGSSTDWLNS